MAVEQSSLGSDLLQGSRARKLSYSPSDLYQAAELLCLPVKPNVDLYSLQLHRFGDQIPLFDLDKHLTAESFYSRDEFTLGYVSPVKDYKSVITEAAGKQFDASLCKSCMPGQQAINALWHKVLEDRKFGILPQDQPLLFRN